MPNINNSEIINKKADRISFRCSVEFGRRVRVACAQTGRTLEELCIEAVSQFLGPTEADAA
jgi:hypothetical protein